MCKERDENTILVDKDQRLRGRLQKERKAVNEEEDIAYRVSSLYRFFQG